MIVCLKETVVTLVVHSVYCSECEHQTLLVYITTQIPIKLLDQKKTKSNYISVCIWLLLVQACSSDGKYSAILTNYALFNLTRTRACKTKSMMGCAPKGTRCFNRCANGHPPGMISNRTLPKMQMTNRAFHFIRDLRGFFRNDAI